MQIERTIVRMNEIWYGSQSQAFTHDMQVLRQSGNNSGNQPDQPKICQVTKPYLWRNKF